MWTFFVETMDKETIGISILKDKYQAFVSWIGGIFFILWNHDTWWYFYASDETHLKTARLSHVDGPFLIFFRADEGRWVSTRWRGRQNEIEIVSRFVEQVSTTF